MKTTLVTLVVLLFVTTLAMGQNEVPFPQGANPALQNGTYVPAVVYTPQNVPSSMAANVGAVAFRTERIDTNSEFPMPANPSFENGTIPQAPFVESYPRIETGSPFPMAADPSSTNQ